MPRLPCSLWILPAIACGWLVGGVVGACWRDPRWWSVTVALGALVAMVTTGLRFAWGPRVEDRPRSVRPLARLAPLAMLGLSLAGGAAASSRRLSSLESASPRPCHVSQHTSRRVVRLTGRVVGSGRLAFGGETRRQLLEAQWLVDPATGARRRLCGRVELRQPVTASPLNAGERVVLAARLRPAAGDRNPGAAGGALRRGGDDVGAVAWPAEVFVVEPRPRGLLVALRSALRRGIQRTLPAGPGRAVISAVVLGERHEIDERQRRRFARAGASHLLAVSGLHLSLVAMFAYAAARWLSRRSAWLLAAGACWPRVLAALSGAAFALGYTALTGASDATLRACALACVVFFALASGRGRDAPRPLALAALVLLAVDPLTLFRPGAQLSFAAVIGILLVLARAERVAPLELDSRRRRLIRSRPARWVRGLALVSLGATLATAPLVAHHFGEVSLVGLAVNLVAVPLTSLALLPLALIGALLAAVASAGSPAGWPLTAAAWLAERLDDLCRLAAEPSWVAVAARPGWPATACLLVVALGLLVAGGWRRRVLLALGCAGIALLGGVSLLESRGLEVTFLDVGQGDATFIRLPDGRGVLVDAGGVGGRRGATTAAADPGARRVLPFLARQGVSRLALVVASHAHADHAGGLEAVLEGIAVEELWLCDQPTAGYPLYRRLIDRARQLGVKVRGPRRARFGAVQLIPRWPAATLTGEGRLGCADPEASANDNSVVLELRFGRSSALLAGDVEQEAEEALVATGLPPAGLLKVPHHGSSTSSSPAFLTRVAPRLAVVSAGIDNRFGLPHPAVLARYRARGVELLRVDRLGAVVVLLGRDGELSWRRGRTVVP